MKKVILYIGCCLLFTVSFAQNITQKLQKAFTQFENDFQLKHAISSLYVIDAKTGQVVFDKNSRVGLVPASTQKIITAVTAFELLGKDYKYITEFWWAKLSKDQSGHEFVLIKPSGDPTLGSNRYQNSTAAYLFKMLSEAYKKIGLNSSKLIYQVYAGQFDNQKIPDGWVWQDIGNYYGAGAYPFNWKENQSDILLSASSVAGDLVTIKSVDSAAGIGLIDNTLRSGARSSGDNAYYYFMYGNNNRPQLPLLKGTIPAGEKNFKISVAVADPYEYFINELIENKLTTKEYSTIGRGDFLKSLGTNTIDELLYTHYSPTLDSIIYWFLKKSINLYGEALLKTIAYEKKGFGATDTGVHIIKDFWKQKGLDPDELNIYDGSGLSPLNRITTHAQAGVLKYAKKQSWLPYFYDALPDYNGMKLKSGTINDVKGFCGYHTSKDRKEYIISFLVNNYSGPSATLVNKMYRVLDILK